MVKGLYDITNPKKNCSVSHYLSACLYTNTIKIISTTFYLVNKWLWWWLLRQEPSLASARMTKVFSLHPHNSDCEQIIPVLMLSQISLLYACSHCLSRTDTYSVLLPFFAVRIKIQKKKICVQLTWGCVYMWFNVWERILLFWMCTYKCVPPL